MVFGNNFFSLVFLTTKCLQSKGKKGYITHNNFQILRKLIIMLNAFKNRSFKLLETFPHEAIQPFRNSLNVTNVT